MTDITRRIGLSLGADSCWPLCFEEILKGLDLDIKIGRNKIQVEAERVTIEPFDLQQPCPYDVVIDRLTHWYTTSREWIKKAVIMDGLYVFNNPWSIQSMEKQTSYCAMMHLGLPVPGTWLIPPKAYVTTNDLGPTLERYARMFDLGEVGRSVGFPMFMKPYDGGAWVGVERIADEDELHRAYEASGTRLMHLQRSVDNYDLFVRCVAVGPQVRIIRYDPAAPLHDRYKVDFNVVDQADGELLKDMTMTINGFFGWDFNSCEALRSGGVYYPIDFANACPDSQVTSLHYHFPWLVQAIIKWSVFCAVTNRPMRQNLDWAPYYKVAAKDLPYRERLAAYAAITEKRLQTDRFEEFCERHLSHVDEVTWDFFGSDRALEAVRSKVASLFPAHEVERFTEHFWGMIQFWRRTEAGDTVELEALDSEREPAS